MPSLYETTAATGDVSSSDFTTLYNASGLTVPNAGAGAVTGNLNVSGNLTVQGTSNLIGPVTIGNTLSTPNYTFPLPDGTTDQVLVTDGNGNLYWTDVTAIPGAAYQIEATTVTGGANLTLIDSAGGQDSVKFAAGTGISVSRTNANTITITNTAPDTNTTYTIDASATTGGANLNLVGSDSTTDTVKFAAGTNITINQTDANTITIATVADNIPDGTADGQVLVWEGGAWTANSNITADASTPATRNAFTGTLPATQSGRANSVLTLVKDTQATPYTTGDGSGFTLAVDSDSQTPTYYSAFNAAYIPSGDGSNIRLATSTNNFAVDLATSITGGNTLVFPTAHGFTANLPIRLLTSSSNGITTNTIYYVLATGLTTTQCQISLTQGGTAVALTNGTGLNLLFQDASATKRVLSVDSNNLSLTGSNLIFRADQTGVAAGNAQITVERGTSGTDATLAWNESNTRWEASNSLFVNNIISCNGESISMNADNTATDSFLNFKGFTQYLKWNNATSQFELSNALQVGGNATVLGNYSQTGETITVNSDSTAADSFLYLKGATQYLKWNNATSRFELSNATQIGGNATVLGNYSQTGESMTINSDSTAADSFLYMKGSTEYLKWNNTDSRFELSDQLYISETDPPAIFERRVLSTDVSPNESKSALRLFERVTDVANNDNKYGGPGIVFGRTYGASGGAERLFAGVNSVWDGTTTTADLNFVWSDDNFTETSPGVFPGTYTLLRAGSNNANFQNNSIYVDYSTAGAAKIGINTGSPAYTLDVNGDANVSGDIYVSGVHVDLSTPVHQGQLLYVSNDVTPTITNSNLIKFTDTTYRTNFQGDADIYGRSLSALGVSNNTGAVPYTTGDGSGLLIGVDSDSQTATNMGGLTSIFVSGGNHQLRLTSSTNNFVTVKATSITGGNTLVFSTAHSFTANQKIFYAGPTQNGLTFNTFYYVLATGLTTTQCQVSLTQGGSAVALTNGTSLNLYFAGGNNQLLQVDQTSARFDAPTLVLNSTDPGTAFSGTAGITVERGTAGADATFNWNESTDRWEASADLFAPQATIGLIDIDRTNGTITTNSGNLTLDSAGGTVAVNADLNVDSGTLFVDSTLNRVGINTLSPTVALTVGGDIIATNSIVAVGVLGTNGGEIIFNNDDGTAADANLIVKRGASPDVSIRWNETTDRWQDTTDGTTYLNLPNQNLDTDSDVNFAGVTVDTISTYNTQSTTTTSTTPTAITSTTRVSQKAIIKIIDNVTGELHMLEALAFRKGTTAYLTTYAEMYTNTALATFTADVSGGFTRIIATPASTNSTSFTVARISLD